MNRVKQLAINLFSKTGAVNSGKGLYATLEELMEQRQYVGYLKNPQNRLATSNQAGDVKSAFKGRGMEFEEIRPYSYGDDVRDIDWRVTARKMQPYTKLFAQEKDREIYVLLDLSPKMVFGTKKELKSVSAAKITSLLGWMALENKDRFGCLIFDGEKDYIFKPQNHRAGVLAILKKISAMTQDILQKKSGKTEGNLAKSLQYLQKNIKNNAIVFVVSDFNDDGESVRKSLATLSQKANLFCINLFDVLEEVAPQSGEYMIENNNQRLIFDTRSERFRKDYQDYFAKKRGRFKDFCHKFRCRYVEVRTDMPLYRQLQTI